AELVDAAALGELCLAVLTVITNSDKVPVNTAKQSSPRAAASTSSARYVNTAANIPTVNGTKSSLNVFYKTHSPVRRTFNQRTTPKNSDLKETINIVKSNLQYTLKHQGIFGSGCSRHMMGNKSFLTDYQEIDGGFVAFGGSPKGGKISIKGKIRTGKLDFEDVYFVKKLKFNLFFVSQMCDKKNSILFTETLTEQDRGLKFDGLLLVQNEFQGSPNLDFMRPFGCPDTILNTLDHLGKFEGKADEGFFVGYSVNTSAPTSLSSYTSSNMLVSSKDGILGSLEPTILIFRLPELIFVLAALILGLKHPYHLSSEYLKRMVNKKA
nr:ribonuclease H-like domain-containing protein [Tanacetum cinerariifolium]